MNESSPNSHDAGRRRFLAAAAAVAAAPLAPRAAAANAPAAGVLPFEGAYQGGIATPMQRHTYFLVFDVATKSRDELVRMLRAWTAEATKMASGPAQFDPKADPDKPADIPGAMVGLPPANLTLTFGFGPSLFELKGEDRFGLAAQRPAALVDLPRFPGDQLIPEHTGGDLSVQACADDPQVVETAVRRLAKLASGVAVMRWAQMGFSGDFAPGSTPRNQMGFKDGTINPHTDNPAEMHKFVWVGDEGPAWMRNGSYMVVRQIRIALEHWDSMKLSFQEETIGRRKTSGAPIGKQHEFDPLDLDALDKEGNPVIAENAHAAMSAPQMNGDMQILRRGYSYDNGVARIAERWPPWRQVMTFDAGLLFQCYQRDPRTGFTPIFAKMAAIDMLNQFTTHVGSGVFACPPGVQIGEFIGQALFG